MANSYQAAPVAAPWDGPDMAERRGTNPPPSVRHPRASGVGKTSWITGLWPKPKDGVYLLVVNKEVRTKEKAYAGEDVRIHVTPL